MAELSAIKVKENQQKKDKSVIDYVICSPSSMMFLSNFELKNVVHFIQTHIM